MKGTKSVISDENKVVRLVEATAPTKKAHHAQLI